jgi:hypothetical protein
MESVLRRTVSVCVRFGVLMAVSECVCVCEVWDADGGHCARVKLTAAVGMICQLS